MMKFKLLTFTTMSTLLLTNPITTLSTYNMMVSNQQIITIKNENVIGDKAKVSTSKKVKKTKPKMDEPETIFDLFTKEERFILYRIVEAECTGLSKECKMNVANVIINRLNSDEFPDTIAEIVFQKVGNVYQFSPLYDKRYYSVEITEETKEACAEIFLQEDTTNESLYFDSCSVSSWAKRNRTYTMNDGYHSFYK